jgi:shikimate dehydrogenase
MEDMNEKMVSGRTRVAAVVGWPIEHSLSPVIHNAGFASTGVDWTYVALRVEPDSRSAIVSSAASLGLGGLSVTMPYKTDVARQVDHLDGSCLRLDSVNTVSFAADGSATGHTTDGDGLVASLESKGIHLDGLRVVVLGTGGAGRSVIEAVTRHEPSEVVLTNRTLEVAESTRTIASAPVRVVEWSTRHDAVRDADLVINCTNLGMAPSVDTPCDETAIGPHQIVVDLVYHPLETPLLRSASARGARVVDGLGMLLHQAALQQKIWTGHLPDVSHMRSVALRALQARG